MDGTVVNIYYYHGLQMGFCAWMVLAPLMLVAVALVGTRQYDWYNGYIARVFDSAWYWRVAIVVTIVMELLLVIESSGDAIIQMLDARMLAAGYPESYLWQSVAGMPLVALLPASAYGIIFYLTGRIAGLAKAGWLYEEKKRWEYRRCQRRERQEAMR